jgi:hypothetical protein
MTLETDPLFILIPQEDSPALELEGFIADVLYRAGVWNSPRVSDGISLLRVVERSSMLARIGGKIHEISQEVHSFWLELKRDENRPEQFNWMLYFDIVLDSLTPRRVATAIEAIDLPEQVSWRIALTGAATSQDAAPLAESVTNVSTENSPL